MLVINLEISGYTNCDKGMNGLGVTSDGTKTTEGILAAPSCIPFNTNVFIPGMGSYIVKDRGGVIIKENNIYHLDIWCRTKEEAYKIGRQRIKGIISIKKTLPY